MVMESALLLVCPEAERVVAAERARLDRAAQDGIPPHLTVLYPFKPLALLTAGDHRRLEEIAGNNRTFAVHLGRVGWFGEKVLYLAPDDPAPVAFLTHQIWSAFPEFAPYRGLFTDPAPHLTVGHDHPADELEAAERHISPRLPVVQQLDHLELWAGPSVEDRHHPAPWQHIRDYPFTSPSRT